MTSSTPTTVTAVAPGRVNLIGEHTDYNHGLCLPYAIPLACTATLTVRDDRGLTIASDKGEPWSGSLDDVEARVVTGWPSYVAGVIWALGQDGWQVPGLDISISSTIPLGGGLSSSAALECAVAVGLAGLLGQDLDRASRLHLAEACRRAETEYVGAPTGGMDQLASLLGAADHAVFIDFADAAPVTDLVRVAFSAADLTIVVTDTGVRHSLADGDGGYAQRREQCEAAAAALGVASLRDAGIDDLGALSDPVLLARARHVVSENARVVETVAALEEDRWADAGTLLTASHTSLRDDFAVSCPELDVSVAAAVDAGALGARMTGGGFGGCTIALVRRDEAPQVTAAIDAAYTARGWSTPRQHELAPSAGADLIPGDSAPE
ncbi:galactokinase [Nocardioides sp. WS12]|uniref:galactokinase n=1 Tax=Nocardioides sp. WS12 TaxID=2486272 RepID=UPI00191DAB05|nr:galactokinase [Nocardioides sp. WS12]